MLVRVDYRRVNFQMTDARVVPEGVDFRRAEREALVVADPAVNAVGGIEGGAGDFLAMRETAAVVGGLRQIQVYVLAAVVEREVRGIDSAIRRDRELRLKVAVLVAERIIVDAHRLAPRLAAVVRADEQHVSIILDGGIIAGTIGDNAVGGVGHVDRAITRVGRGGNIRVQVQRLRADIIGCQHIWNSL